MAGKPKDKGDAAEATGIDIKKLREVAKTFTPEQTVKMSEMLGLAEGKDLIEALDEHQALVDNKGNVKADESGFGERLEEVVETIKTTQASWDKKFEELIAARNEDKTVQELEEAEAREKAELKSSLTGRTRTREAIEAAETEDEFLDILASLETRGAMLHLQYKDWTPQQRRIMVPSKKEEVKAQQRFNDTLVIMAGLLTGKDLKRPTVGEMYRQYPWLADLAKAVGFDNKNFTKSMDNATASEGLEWVPELFSADLIERFDLSLVLASLFAQFPMRAKTVHMPREQAYPTGYLVEQALTDDKFFQNMITASMLETGEVIFAPVKLGSVVFHSDELEEDSIIPVVERIRRGVVRALRNSIEDATLNGTTGTNDLDNAQAAKLFTAAADSRRAWNGIRKTIATSGVGRVDAQGTITTQLLRKVRRKMGKYAHDPEGLAWLFSIGGHNLLLDLKDSSPNGRNAVLTLNELGPNATILRGQLAQFDAIPIIVSQYARDDYEANGYYDGAGAKDKTSAQLVWREAFMYGNRREMTVERDRNMLAEISATAAKMRIDFKKVYPTAEFTENEIYNITVA